MSTNIPESSLPPRPVFGNTLESLGYFVNQDSRIRKISNPEEGFMFDKTKDERIAKLEAHALQQAVRRLVLFNLATMGIETMTIPVDADVEGGPRTKILVTKNLEIAKRIIVVCGDETEDMGIFSYLDTLEEGLFFGTLLGLVMCLTKGSLLGDMALVVLNPAQRFWNPQTELAESLETFRLRDAPSLITPVRDPTRRNEIPGNRTPYEHTEYVFEHILMPLMRGNTNIDVLGIAEGGFAMYKFLKDNWSFWRTFTSNMTLVDPRQIFDPATIPDLRFPNSFASFMRDRCRAWVRSDLPLGSHEIGIGARGCNCYAAGETMHINAMLPRSLKKVLMWMELMHANPTMKEVPCLVEGEAYMLERADRNGPPAEHDWAGSYVLCSLLRLSWCGPQDKLERKYQWELSLFGHAPNDAYVVTPENHINATMGRVYGFLEALEALEAADDGAHSADEEGGVAA